MHFLFALLLLFQTTPAFENEYVQVFKNSAPCAGGGVNCAERIIVALAPIELGGRQMARGEIKVFGKNEKYTAPKGGNYLEVVMRPVRPPVKTTPVTIAP